MGQHISKCTDCGIYTMKNQCPHCGGKTINPKPARFSLEDRYGKYRRLLTRQIKKT